MSFSQASACLGVQMLNTKEHFTSFFTHSLFSEHSIEHLKQRFQSMKLRLNRDNAVARPIGSVH